MEGRIDITHSQAEQQGRLGGLQIEWLERYVIRRDLAPRRLPSAHDLAPRRHRQLPSVRARYGAVPFAVPLDVAQIERRGEMPATEALAHTYGLRQPIFSTANEMQTAPDYDVEGGRRAPGTQGLGVPAIGEAIRRTQTHSEVIRGYQRSPEALCCCAPRQ